MTRFLRNSALAKLYGVIENCREPELIVEAAIMSTVFENRSAFLFLQSVGLEVKVDLMEVKVRDRTKARELMEKMVSSGRNLNKMRPIAVDHAVMTATELGLTIHRYGHVQRLMEAIRYLMHQVDLGAVWKHT